MIAYFYGMSTLTGVSNGFSLVTYTKKSTIWEFLPRCKERREYIINLTEKVAFKLQTQKIWILKGITFQIFLYLKFEDFFIVEYTMAVLFE